MRLQLNNEVYTVPIEPIKRRATDAMTQLISAKGGDNPLMRQIVKQACQMAMGHLGIVKPDRNSDPIELVALHVAELIFHSLEESGLVLEGVKINESKSTN